MPHESRAEQAAGGAYASLLDAGVNDVVGAIGGDGVRDPACALAWGGP